MKIILRGLNGEFVNFDNVFKIDVLKPYESDNPYKVMAYLEAMLVGITIMNASYFRELKRKLKTGKNRFRKL